MDAYRHITPIERGWGEGSNQWKNRNFGSSITLLTPSPTLPRSVHYCPEYFFG